MGKKRNRNKNKIPRNTSRIYESDASEPLGEPVGFRLDGYDYICRELGALELSHMARMNGKAADDPEAIAFMAELFETLLGKQQYDIFRLRCGQFMTKPEKFVEIIEGVFEDFTSRPTGRPSDSLSGPQTTGKDSTQDSSSQALELLKNRPDLQAAVLASERARRSNE
jgi:hypothetical protein